MTATQIAVAINNARGQGKQVVLNTKDVQPNNSPLAGDHAYVVTSLKQEDTDGDGAPDKFTYILYNPWGGSLATAEVPVDLLDDTIESFQILENIP